MPSFVSHYCIPIIWWVFDIDATIGMMSKMLFFLLSVSSCSNKTLIL